jgi:tetratricopeptide (TPR) repeat protein
MSSRRLAIVLASLLVCGKLGASDFEAALDRAREAAAGHRYAEVIELLTSFNSISDPETRYVTAAEIGRAYFHLGRYREAHQAFRQAVWLRPERVETAVYLEATSYLVGEKEQAYAILREILKSDARDLFLAVTLPGERSFAVDPEVQTIISEYAVPLEVDPERAEVLGLSLGAQREMAIEQLGIQLTSADARGLTASAGPALIWALVFDDEHELDEVLLQAENLLRYTPYRLRVGDTLDWKATPAAAIAAFGPPDRTSSSVDEGITMTWDRFGHKVIFDFGNPRHPRPLAISEGPRRPSADRDAEPRRPQFLAIGRVARCPFRR